MELGRTLVGFKMSVLEVEQGAPIGDKAQEMTNMVHYTMKYIIKDGQDLSEEMTSLAIDVLTKVTEERRECNHSYLLLKVYLFTYLHTYACFHSFLNISLLFRYIHFSSS